MAVRCGVNVNVNVNVNMSAGVRRIQTLLSKGLAIRLVMAGMSGWFLSVAAVNAQETAAEGRSAGDDVMAVAKRVAGERFEGFTYGAALDRKQINCVQFTGAVVEALLGRALTKEETDALYIRYHFEDLQAAVESGEERTKGIQRALAEVMKCGAAVEATKVQAGDFVQYWIKGQDGKWAGHSAVVSRVFSDAEGPAGIAIYSSNRSTNGIAEMDFEGRGLSLRKDGRRFYFVRFATEAKAKVPR